ncbi:hypothetical protein OXV57_01280 [Bacteroides fragilis]|uniref:hypothetical protein n=2 Tax=Bacteroides TaxID=816 RepID=UPI00189BFD98|nr:hypothetical protein [Bacteroides hominis (ex Liu et al. 2022)]MCY6333666.1 hypothetical protein [Bacteroides fragilis]MDV6146419.1 hypothetical protein [Bacteroides hominis (ex Liu et al. 2022)]
MNYRHLHLLSPRITIDASYIKQITMKENQNEEEVLLMADKDDDSKLKAVDKSAAKEGIWRLLLPSMETTVFLSPFRIRRTCLPTCWDIPKTTGSHRPVQDQSE